MRNPFSKLRDVTRPYRRRIAANRAGGNNENKPVPYKEQEQKEYTFDIEQLELSLKNDFLSNQVADLEDSFFLARVIGNDLYPRHSIGQSEINIKYILDNEPDFFRCSKYWIINRIIDKKVESKIKYILDLYSQNYSIIPFDLNEYSREKWDFGTFSKNRLYKNFCLSNNDGSTQRMEILPYRNKNNYTMNNNGARNLALEIGKRSSKWILPWDGNCFFTRGAWEEFIDLVRRKPHFQHIVVPMARIVDHADLDEKGYRPTANEEPQIAFRCDSRLTFNPSWPYGHRPKVELLWRLGAPGPWDVWSQESWHLPRPEPAQEFGNFQTGGWVARLPSGFASLEVGTAALQTRGSARDLSIRDTLDKLDLKVLSQQFSPEDLVFYIMLDSDIDSGNSAHPTREPEADVKLISDADKALGRGPYSVMNKVATPPSGDKHDYFHPAPYWWPNPSTEDGLPYIWRDGIRVPGTKLFDSESNKFDRTSMQSMLQDVTTLALAWLRTRNTDYAEHASSLVRTWFLDPQTRMNPNLRFAQVRLGHNRDQGSRSGIIEASDFYFFLDAVRIIVASDFITDKEKEELQNWFSVYSDWLEQSVQGREACASDNNHGTYYDLQAAAIAAFLNSQLRLLRIFRCSHERLLLQFSQDGTQAKELARTNSAHYCCYNLQGWVNLATLGDACGQNLWDYRGNEGQGLQVGLDWFLSHWHTQDWPYEQITHFDWRRCAPLLSAYLSAYDRFPSGFDLASVKACLSNPPPYDSDDGIPPHRNWSVVTSDQSLRQV